MKPLSVIRFCVSVLLPAAFGWLAIQATAFAQAAKEEAAKPGGSYVLPYAIVILGVALGMLVVCRPSGRRDRARPEQYGQSKPSLQK